MMPSLGTRPTVGLIPTQPFSDAGQVIDPSVSVPIPIVTSPAATAAPVPDEDPPALCWCFQGLAVNPHTADQPEVDLVDRMFAHSDKFVEATIIPPASLIRFAMLLSLKTGVLVSASEPAVAGKPTKIGRAHV